MFKSSLPIVNIELSKKKKKKKKSHALHKLPTRIYDDQDQLQLND